MNHNDKTVESVCWFEPNRKDKTKVVLRIDNRGKSVKKIEKGLRKWAQRK